MSALAAQTPTGATSRRGHLRPDADGLAGRVPFERAAAADARAATTVDEARFVAGALGAIPGNILKSTFGAASARS
jgi:hypothetical protein